MASTYSPNLRLELIGTGEQQGTWGATTNTNLGTLLEEAIGGYTTVTVSDSGDTTLTTVNGGADQSRNMVLNLTGTLTATRNVIAPAIEKVYIIKNSTTGGFAVTVKVSGQTGISIPNGSTTIVYVDGTDVRSVLGTIASQNANAVSITGGNVSVTNVTATNVSGTNLSSSNVTITGGSLSGLSNLSVANATVATTVRGNLSAAQSGNNTDITSVYLNNTGLKIKDTDASHGLSIVPGSNLTADRTLTVTTGDAARTLDISASNVTVTVAGAALIDDASAADQRTTLGLGTAAVLNVGTSANNIVQLDGSAKLPAVDGSQLTNLPIPTANANGQLIRAPRTLTSGTSYTTPANCTTIIVELVGGGGGGGTSNASAVGTGGGAGGYAVKTFSVTGNTAYTYAIGSGGAAGSVGVGGGNTTFTAGGVTVTAYGGGGGYRSTSTSDGPAGGGTLNADFSVSGGAAVGCLVYSTTPAVYVSGSGGSSQYGRGGASGSSPTGYGAGGGGAVGNVTQSATAGTAGLIRVWEYT